MRTIGIDLAITSAHKAIVCDQAGQFVTPVLSVQTRPSDLDDLLARARSGAADAAVQVVMEPTGMAWFPVAVYYARQEVPLYLVNSQEVADLRRYYKRHAKSDRIDARVLARLPFVNPDKLHRLILSSAPTLACQRGCKELDRLADQIVATKNRLHALDQFAWLGFVGVNFSAAFGKAARFVRQQWYDPRQVHAAGAAAIRAAWSASRLDPDDGGAWAEPLVALAAELLRLYGAETAYLDFALLQAEVRREQERLAVLEQQHHTLQLQSVRPLYRQIHRSRNLETIKGVGQDGAAVYASFIGDPQRFASQRAFRGWSGMVPSSAQSAESEAKGLHITQAGPDLIKKYAFIDAETARQRDVQIAAIYYEQMVHKGKHHNQAVCACATHLLDRVLVVLQQDKPYELRDVDGRAVSAEEARAIIAERYTVPQEVRRRKNKRTRRDQAERRAERQLERESRSR